MFYAHLYFFFQKFDSDVLKLLSISELFPLDYIMKGEVIPVI